MAHTEFGFQVVQQFLAEITPYGHQDFEPKLIGRGINVMITPLPRNKRAKGPRQTEGGEAPPPLPARVESHRQSSPVQVERAAQPAPEEPESGGFSNNPFAQLEINR
jgi:translation initiation factor IF-3